MAQLSTLCPNGLPGSIPIGTGATKLGLRAFTDREIWQVQYRPKAGVKLSNYGNRAERFIVWAQDSASVTIPTSSDRKVTLSLPIP